MPNNYYKTHHPKYCTVLQQLFLSVLLSVLLCVNSVRADDTELYINLEAIDEPNLLFLLDNSASMLLQSTGVSKNYDSSVIQPNKETRDRVEYNRDSNNQLIRTEIVNGTTFEPNEIYYTDDNRTFVKLDVDINACSGFTKEKGVLSDHFKMLVAFNHRVIKDQWRNIKQGLQFAYRGTVMTGKPVALECKSDEGLHGLPGDQAQRNYISNPRSTVLDDNIRNVNDLNSSDPDYFETMANWWGSSNTGIFGHAAAKHRLGYGNYWNWYFTDNLEYVTRWDNVVDAFNTVIDEEKNKNIGIMVFSNSDKQSYSQSLGRYFNNSYGAYVHYPLVDINESANKTALKNSLNDVEIVFYTPLGEMMYEAARYFRASNAHLGNDSNSSTKSHPGALNGTAYKSPINSSCQKHHIVLMSDGAPTGNTHASEIQNYLNDNRVVEQTNYVCSNNAKTCMDSVATFLNKEDASSNLDNLQNVTVHTVGFALDKDENGNLTDKAQDAQLTLQSTAQNGGGGYYAADSAQDLLDAFKNIADALDDTPGAPAAPTIPLSSSNRFSVGERLYVAQFQPSETRIWQGNIKSYKLDDKTFTVSEQQQDPNDPSQTVTVDVERSALVILDTDDNPVLNDDGTIKDTARSYWSDAVDGAQVNQGGMRDKLTDDAILYLSNSLDDKTQRIESVDDFSKISLESMDVSTPEERERILRWALNYEQDPDAGNNERAAFIADPLHSQPTVLSYTQSLNDEPRQVLYFGSNLGFLHSVDTSSGTEIARWMPEELLPNLKKQYEKEEISNTKSKLYGLDGYITLDHQDTNNNTLIDPGETAMLYIGMRRGGKNYYALDVSDPESPKLEWSIHGGDEGFEDLGYTWSKMLLHTMRYKGAYKRVLVFSGGYDVSHDQHLPKTSWSYNSYVKQWRHIDAVGRGVYIVDAQTGQRLWSVGTTGFTHDAARAFLTASTPATPAVLDTEGDGLIDMILTVDISGQMMRYDILNAAGLNNSSADANDFIKVDLIARLAPTILASNTKSFIEFFSQPSAAIVNNGTIYSISIALGSGRRYKPNSKDIWNSLFVVRQTNIYTDDDSDKDSTFLKISNLALANLNAAIDDEDSSQQDINISNDTYTDANGVVISRLDNNGFRAPLGNTGSIKRAGEKVLGSASILNGVAVFATYIPDQDGAALCEAAGLGTNNLYALDIVTGRTVQTFQLQQKGVFGDVSTFRYKGKKYVNAPVNLPSGAGGSNNTGEVGFVNVTSEGGDDNGEAAVDCAHSVCLPSSNSAFYKFWIERAL